MPGLIEGIYQPFAMFCAAAMLWERQHQQEIERSYVDLERQVAEEI